MYLIFEEIILIHLQFFFMFHINELYFFKKIFICIIFIIYVTLHDIFSL